MHMHTGSQAVRHPLRGQRRHSRRYGSGGHGWWKLGWGDFREWLPARAAELEGKGAAAQGAHAQAAGACGCKMHEVAKLMCIGMQAARWC
eukprot:scaffold77728_cov17-Tisochrysis_lutea.AAC.1